MGMLERLSDVKGTVEGKIVAIVLAVLLVLPMASISAFAGGHEDDPATAPDDTVEVTATAEDTVIPDTGATPVDEIIGEDEATTPNEEEPASTDEPVGEDEVSDAVVALNLDEGALVKHGNKTYTVYSEEMGVSATEDVKFTAEAEEGFALAEETPVMLVAFDGTETELTADADGVYTITPEQVAQNLVLQVHTVAIEVPAIEENTETPDQSPVDEAATFNEEKAAKTAPESAKAVIEVPSITFEAWCTSKRLLGDVTLTTDVVNAVYPGLLESGGLSPAAFAKATTTASDGGNYAYSHAQVFPTKKTDFGKDPNNHATPTNQTTNDYCNMYNTADAISALRFNTENGKWEVLKGGSWSSINGSTMQLVSYYRAKQSIAGDENEAVYSKDWASSVDQYKDGNVGVGSAACVIYQYYDQNGNRIPAKKLLTFFYSNSKSKDNVTVSPKLGFEIDKIKLMPLKDSRDTCVNHYKTGSCPKHSGHSNDANDKNFKNAPILKYTPPAKFDKVNGNEVQNPFTIPWKEGRWGDDVHACVVAVKLKDATAENRLSVKYLDKDGNAIEGIAPVSDQPVVLKGTTEKPTWFSFLDQIQSSTKVSAKPGYVGQGGVLVPKNAEQEMIPIDLDIQKQGYAAEHFKAEVTGDSNNVLKLYFHKIYDITYEWNLPDGAVLGEDVAAQKPSNVIGAAEGTDYTISNLEQGLRAYTYSTNADGTKTVTGVYQFSGWTKKDDPTTVVSGETGKLEQDIALQGKWERLTYSATITGTGKKYDSAPAAISVNTEGKALDGTPEYAYRTVITNEDGTIIYGEPVSFDPSKDEGPTDAGTYVVSVKWAATDSQPEVTAESSPFVIKPRTITITSAGDEKLYDGQPLTKNDPDTDLTIGAEGDDGFAPNESFAYNITGTVTNPGESVDNVFEVKAGSLNTKLENYAITKVYGTLIVNSRSADDLNLLAITLTPRSLTVPYTGTEVKLSGIAQINGEPTTNDEFVMNGVTYKISSYRSGIEGTNAGTYNNNISPDGQYVITQGSTDVTSQFSVNVAKAGTLTITPREITLSSESGTKVYNGQPLMKPDVTVASAEQNVPEGIIAADELFKQEYKAEATGSITNVYDEDNGKVGNNVIVKTTLTSDTTLEFLAKNYKIVDEQPGTLTVTPRNIAPTENQDGVDPTDPDSGYHQMTVGDLDPKPYKKESYEPEQNPVVMNGIDVLKKAADGVDHPDYTQTSTSAIDAGDVTVTITGEGNYTGTVKVPYEITPKAVVITVKNAWKKYGTPDSAVKFDGTVDGVITGDVLGDITYYRDRTGLQGDDISDPVGEYGEVLKASVSNLNTNYTWTFTPGEFNITQLEAPTINVNNVTKIYDGQASSIEATLAGEDANNWKLEYSVDGGQTWTEENPAYTDVKVSEDGTRAYDVEVRAVPKGDASNYANPPAINSGTVTIDPAEVTIQVDSATKVAGTDDPEFTGTVEGEINGHPITGLHFFRNGNDEGVGTYAGVLEAAFDENPNYAVKVEMGDFTITPMAVPPTVPTGPVPPAPGPIDAIITFLETPVLGGPGVTAAIGDEPTPLGEGAPVQEEIQDDGTPLSTFDHPFCWVHYYIILGIIITAIYGGGVIVRRLGYNHKIKKYEDDVTGKEKKRGLATDPTPEPVKPVI